MVFFFFYFLYFLQLLKQKVKDMTYLIDKEKRKITELDKKKQEEIGNSKSLIKCAKLGEGDDIPCTQLSNLGKIYSFIRAQSQNWGKFMQQSKGLTFRMIYIEQGEQGQNYGKYMLQGADYQNLG